LHKIKS